METKTIKLYSLNELSESARKKALSRFADECYKNMSRCLWHDAEHTLDWLKETTGCTFDISSSTQGYSCRVRDEKYNYTPEYDDSHDDRRFARLQKKIQQMEDYTWADGELKKEAEIHKWRTNPYASDFCGNLSTLVCHFCQDIEYAIYDICNDDNTIADYITNSLEIGCQFTEDGKYIEI